MLNRKWALETPAAEGDELHVHVTQFRLLRLGCFIYNRGRFRTLIGSRKMSGARNLLGLLAQDAGFSPYRTPAKSCELAASSGIRRQTLIVVGNSQTCATQAHAACVAGARGKRGLRFSRLRFGSSNQKTYDKEYHSHLEPRIGGTVLTGSNGLLG